MHPTFTPSIQVSYVRSLNGSVSSYAPGSVGINICVIARAMHTILRYVRKTYTWYITPDQTAYIVLKYK